MTVKPTRLLADRAYETIRHLVLDCELAPGSFVSERGLAAEHGFGIAATRAALVRLSSEGLFTAVPRVGYQVAPITLRSVNAFFEAWGVIAPEFVALAHSRMTEAHYRAIEELSFEPDAPPERRVAQANEAWEVLMDAADNAVFTEVMRRLNRDMHRIFLLAMRHAPEMMPWSVADVGGRSDPETARRRAVEIMEGSRRLILAWLSDAPSLADVELTFR